MGFLAATQCEKVSCVSAVKALPDPVWVGVDGFGLESGATLECEEQNNVATISAICP